jgi:hypothetical protein
MDGRKLVRELPLGLLMVGSVVAIVAFVHWNNTRKAPSATPPAAGQTFTGAAAANLHPKVPPRKVDRSRFATLPPDCGCELASGARAQLLMAVTGRQQAITDQGSAVYVIHELAVAKGDAVLAFPLSDDVAPGNRTEGFATRFDVACDGERMVVVDPVHATLWDLAGDRPKRVWSTRLAARRGAVVAQGTELSIDCATAQLDGDAVAIADAGTAPVKLGLADGVMTEGPREQ